MPIHVRALLWPLALAVVAVLIFDVRIGRDMVDFGVYRVAAGRALASEPLYREGPASDRPRSRCVSRH